jgi:hypothetical protein
MPRMRKRERRGAWLSAAQLACAVWLVTIGCAARVRAYCIASSCNATACPAPANCAGHDLHWSGGSATVAIDATAAPPYALTQDEVEEAVSDALSAWTEAMCPSGAHPALHVQPLSFVTGTDIGFVQGGHNQSIVTFFDENWPFEANAVAKTRLNLDDASGELEDADVALNADRFPLALDDAAGDVDMVAVLTHEFGHFFGLGHSAVPGATMQPETMGFGTRDLRSLEADDVAAICALYPPERAGNEEPSSGCSVTRISSAVPMRASPLSMAGLIVWFLWRRRRTIERASASGLSAR